jgi:hypothetical protein
LICVNGFRLSEPSFAAMGRGLKWDWMQIAGYASLIMAGLTLAMLLAF